MSSQNYVPVSSPDTQPFVPQAPSAQAPGVVKGASLVIKGELTASEDLVLHGQVEGTVSLPNHKLTIGNGAHVDATVVAKDVVVQGFVIGKVTANSKLEVAATARMNGELSSPKVVMADGAEFSGQINMPSSNSDKNKKQAPLAVAV